MLHWTEAPRVLVLAVSLTGWFAGPAQSQNLLGFHRVECPGKVEIVNPQTDVPAFQSRLVVPRRGAGVARQDLEVAWTCNGQNRPMVTCPANTAKVMVDRTQGRRFTTIICLRR